VTWCPRPREAGIASVVLAAGLVLGAGTARAEPRVVAVGDIHGAYAELVSILAEAGLIDHRQQWTGGDTILVQTGDFLDRGTDSLEVAELLMELQRQAPDAGGKVVVLLGNHEALNLIGDMRYVPPRIYAPLADGASDTRRRWECSQRVKAERKASPQQGESKNEAFLRCLDHHPPGLVEYFEILGPDRPLGRWLRSLPAVARIGDVLFVHGGLSPALGDWSVDEINLAVHDEIAAYDRMRAWLHDKGLIFATSDLVETHAAAKAASAGEAKVPLEVAAFLDVQNWLVLRQDGPLWFRGYSHWSDEEGGPQVDSILERFGARYLVVGHTPGKTRRIDARFGDRVFLIDTGMLASQYRGVPAALEIHDGAIRAVYKGYSIGFVDPSPAPPAGEPRVAAIDER